MSLSRWAWLLMFILRSHEARLAHIHFLWNAAWFFDLWRKPTIPVLVTAHGSDVNNAFEDPRYGGRVRRALGAADAVVCVSRFIKERLMALGCPEDKLIVNPLGVHSQDRCLPAGGPGPDFKQHQPHLRGGASRGERSQVSPRGRQKGE